MIHNEVSHAQSLIEAFCDKYKENLPMIAGGDDLTVQVNLTPLGRLGETPPEIDLDAETDKHFKRLAGLYTDVDTRAEG